jgi:integrase
MHGYVIRKRDRYYAVIYEGLDPVTGREQRSWHPAGTDRSEAERLAARLAAECNGRNDGLRRSPSGPT